MASSNMIKICIIFLLGFLIANIINLYFISGFESPFSYILLDNSSAPYDFVKENQIEMFDDKIIIYLKDASLSRYAPTGSMLPLFDENANGIRIKPESEQDIHIGDIISFQKEMDLIVHRVIEIGSDEKGIYFITKGDNNDVSDGKIRFKDIKYITIGVIW